MNKLLGYGVLAAFLGTGLNVAHADEATTTGGVQIKSADGNFDARIGGRVHFDGEVIVPDHGSSFGSGASNNTCVIVDTVSSSKNTTVPGKCPSGATTLNGDAATFTTVSERNGGEKSSFYFRRLFLSLTGHLYGWNYLIDEDFAATGSNGLNDAWISHAILGGDAFYFGQHKPWRSMEEISSNNITPFMERSIVSDSGGGSTGIYGGRDYEDGIFYKITRSFGTSNLFAGFSFYTLGKASNLAAGAPAVTVNTTTSTSGTNVIVVSNSTTTPAQAEGTGYNFRVAFAPIVSDGFWVHTGASASFDNADYSGGFTTLSSGYQFIGRQGATATLASYATSPLGNNPSVTTLAGEVAGAFGPAFVLAEFADAHYSQPGKAGDNVTAATVIGTFQLTGETVPYDKNLASYGGIKPKNAFGALQLLARFDYGRNNGGGSGSFVGSTVPSGATADRLYSVTGGINYYINPAVRFMLNYMHGTWDSGAKGKDNANSFEGRVSLLF